MGVVTTRAPLFLEMYIYIYIQHIYFIYIYIHIHIYICFSLGPMILETPKWRLPEPSATQEQSSGLADGLRGDGVALAAALGVP